MTSAIYNGFLRERQGDLPCQMLKQGLLRYLRHTIIDKYAIGIMVAYTRLSSVWLERLTVVGSRLAGPQPPISAGPRFKSGSRDHPFPQLARLGLSWSPWPSAPSSRTLSSSKVSGPAVRHDAPCRRIGPFSHPPGWQSRRCWTRRSQGHRPQSRGAAVHDHEVRLLADLDGTDLVRHTDRLGAFDRGEVQRFLGRSPPSGPIGWTSAARPASSSPRTCPGSCWWSIRPFRR